ncbi:MAG: peptidylprolyl isomerase [Clostridia bacterium]
MSASTKRKTRQAEIEAGTYKKQAAQKERDEKKAKEKRTFTICVAFVAVLVVAAILLNVIPAIKNKQELRRYTEGTAVTIGDRSYSPAEIKYLYANQFQNFANSYYATLFGLDTSKGASGLGSVAYNGPEMEGKSYASWRDYFLDSVYTQLGQIQTMLGYARENGITLSDEEKAQVEENISTFETYAKTYGYPNVDQFLEINLGKGLTLDTIRGLEQDSALANKAYTAYQESLSFTDGELDEEYASFNGNYDTYSYAYYQVKPEAAEGEEPSELAIAEAKASADAIIASYQDGYDVEDLYERLNGYIEEELGGSATRNDDMNGSYLSGAYADWVKDAARQPGDITRIEDGNDQYVVLFLGHKDAAYPTVNVRHILIQAEKGEDGTWSEEALAAAKAEAERILAEYEAGARTEESFAALAEQYSTDEGSKANGGLYENVAKGQMVQEFNDFCFAEGRRSGDTGIVYGTNGQYAGYHVMYYVGEGELYSELLARNSLTEKAIESWLNDAAPAVVPGAEEVLVDPVTAPIATTAPQG